MNQQLSLLSCLEAGIPVTLLLDLAHQDGPDSRAIYRAEQTGCTSD